jgi:hypothetical protein
MHRPEPMTWRGSWRVPNGRRYRIEACQGHRPPLAEASGTVAWRRGGVVTAGAKVQVHPAALPLTVLPDGLVEAAPWSAWGMTTGTPGLAKIPGR